MTNIRSTNLLTPPKEEEEVYPYRRAWRSVALESGTLMVLAGGLYLTVGLLGITIPATANTLLAFLLALSPAILWLLFSRLPERFVEEPRRRLATVFFVSALVANAVGLPLLDDFIQPESWLSLESAFTRILGYMTTVGILQEALKYVVIRYIVWPRYYRVRADAVAYGAASAMAYALVLNLAYVANNPTASLDVVAIRVFANTSVQLVGSMIVAYGLAQTLFDDAIAVLLPASLVIASLYVGIAVPLRTSFANAPLGLTVSAPRDWLGLGFAIALYLGPILAMLFLFDVADRRERDKLIGQEA